jgi:hypothetical protein
LSPYNIEQFVSGATTYPDISNNIGELQGLEKKTRDNIQTILQKYADISNNIHMYNEARTKLSQNNSKYHYDDVIEPTAILKKQDEDNIRTVLQKDLNQLNLYQNSVYITSAIACATLAIAIIIIMPSQKK